MLPNKEMEQIGGIKVNLVLDDDSKSSRLATSMKVMPKTKLDVRYAECPFYLDQEGRWWNRWYKLITESQNFSRSRDISNYVDEIQDIVKYVRSNPKPDPANFKKYFAYEQALMNWKTDIENRLSNLRVKLPMPVSRHYGRPRFRASEELFREATELQRSSEKKIESEGNSSKVLRDGRDIVVWKKPDTRKISLGLKDARLNFWSQTQVWGTTFIPVEPNPENFGTYKSYEDAMRRWASVVQSQKNLPLHSLDIADISAIIMPCTSRFVDIDDNVDGYTLGDSVERWSNPMQVAFFDSESDAELHELPSGCRLIGMRSGERLLRKGPLFENVTQTSRSQFGSALSALVSNSESNKMTYGTYSPPILGELPTALLQTAFYGEFIQSSDDWKITEKGTESVETESFAKWVRSRIFSPINYRMLVRDVDYQHRLCNEMQVLHASLAPRPVNPHRKLDTPGNPEYLKAFSFLSKNQKNLSLERVLVLFQGKLKLDEFIGILDAKVDSDCNKSVKISTLILSCLNSGDLRLLLDFFENSHSELLRSKVAYFFCASSSSEFMQEFVCSIANKEELKVLSMTAYALTYFRPVAIDLFPYRGDLLESACRLIGEEYRDSIERILISYYIDLCENRVYLPIDKLMQTRKMPPMNLTRLVRDGLRFYDREFLSKLFVGMANNSRKVALFFLFLTVQVLHLVHENVKIREILFRPSSSVLKDGMIQLAASRYSHSKFAFKSIEAVLLSSDARLAHYCMEFIYCGREGGGDKEDAFKSLFLVPNQVPVSYLEFLVEVIKSVMTRSVVLKDPGVKLSSHRPSDRYLCPTTALFLLSSSVLSKLLQSIICSTEGLDRIAVVRSRLLKLLLRTVVGPGSTGPPSVRHLTSTFLRSSEKDAIGETSPPTFEMSHAEISALISFLNSTRRYSRSSVADECKTQILQSVRYMLKTEQFSQFVSSDDGFHKVLSHLCSFPPQRLNLEAWRCFCTLLSYRHACAQQLYEKNYLGLYFQNLKTTHDMVLMQNMFECIYTLLIPLRKKKLKSNWHHHFSHMRVDFLDKPFGVAKVIHHYFIESRSYSQIYNIFQRLATQKSGSAYAYLARIYYVLCWRQPKQRLSPKISIPEIKVPPAFYALADCSYWKYQEKEIFGRPLNFS